MSAARSGSARRGDRDTAAAGEPREAAAGTQAPTGSAAGRPRDPVLDARGLAAGYSDRTVLAGVDVSLPPGRLTCLLGANGTGKTTLLRTLTGMQPPLAGQVTLLGDDVTRLPALERARRLAVVLTGSVDAGLLRTADLVALGRYPHTGWGGRLGADDRDAVEWALAVAGAERLADRQVSTLSDGERQRVLIARALAQEPAVLALDEPTAFVDLPRRAELAQLLGDLARECDLAVLMTTHDLDLALRAADDVWLLEETGESTRLLAGGPEDLALSGAVGRAFASAETTFDVSLGRFVPKSPALARATVIGDGDRAVWARRALERAGLDVAGPDERASLTVTVRESDWEVTGAGRSRSCASLAELVDHVRGLVPLLLGRRQGP